MQPAQLQADGQEEDRPQGALQDAARHLHGDQRGRRGQGRRQPLQRPTEPRKI